MTALQNPGLRREGRGRKTTADEEGDSDAPTNKRDEAREDERREERDKKREGERDPFERYEERQTRTTRDREIRRQTNTEMEQRKEGKKCVGDAGIGTMTAGEQSPHPRTQVEQDRYRQTE